MTSPPTLPQSSETDHERAARETAAALMMNTMHDVVEEREGLVAPLLSEAEDPVGVRVNNRAGLFKWLKRGIKD